MPRNADQNEQVREQRQAQILDAALSEYVRRGYHGADMDAVAKEARLAKGLIYYYYRTKKELFQALFDAVFTSGAELSGALIAGSEGQDPVERLMRYCLGMFMGNKDDPRMMQFFIRAPFDAFAVFDPDKWENGAAISAVHKNALAEIISEGMEKGLIPAAPPASSANSFWTVFVANLFEYSRLILGENQPVPGDAKAFRDAVSFCFNGLGVNGETWNGYFEKAIREKGEKPDENTGKNL